MAGRKHYKVTAPYVTVKTLTPDLGPAIVGLYQNNPVPDDAEPAWIEHHLARGLITETGTAEAVAATAAVTAPVEPVAEAEAPAAEPEAAPEPPAPASHARRTTGRGAAEK
jgi:hypothetical protein